MSKDKVFIFRLDSVTDKQLEKVAKEYGLSKGSTINLLIKHEYHYFKEYPEHMRK